MTDATFRLGPIGQLAHTVKDIRRATAFYRDRLGLAHLFSAGNLAFFDCDGVRLMLSTPEAPEFDHPGSPLYFTIPDVEAAFRALSERGVEFEDRPHMVGSTGSHDIWLAFFRDGEGNLLAVMEERIHE